jgi:hypothetical protein
MVQELKAAGVDYQDREVVVDDNLITARQPVDLPAFMQATFKGARPGLMAGYAHSIYIHMDAFFAPIEQPLPHETCGWSLIVDGFNRSRRTRTCPIILRNPLGIGRFRPMALWQLAHPV